jgi:hypothetical protein
MKQPTACSRERERSPWNVEIPVIEIFLRTA